MMKRSILLFTKMILIMFGVPQLVLADLRRTSQFVEHTVNPRLPTYNEWLAENYKSTNFSVLSPSNFGCPTNWWGGSGSYNNYEYVYNNVKPNVDRALKGFSQKAKQKCSEYSYIIKNGKATQHYRNRGNSSWTSGTIFLKDKRTEKSVITIAAFTSDIMAGGKSATIFNNDLEQFCTATIKSKSQGVLDCSAVGLGKQEFVFQVSENYVDYNISSDNEKFSMFATNLSEREARNKFRSKLKPWN